MTDGEKSSKAVVTQRRSHAWYKRDDRDGFIHRSWLKNQNYPADAFGGRGGAVPGDLHWTRKRPSVSSMKSLALIATLVSSLFGASTSALFAVDPNAHPKSAPAFWEWARTPPMGWNSWDSFGTAVTEAEVKAQANYMSEHLLAHGFEYLVVDIQWYEPNAVGHDYHKGAELVMDQYGRLQPAPNRFPSAAQGAGFKALADYAHGKGLKFGLHLLRGIPRQAVTQNTPVLNSSARAASIADTKAISSWNTDMYGVDMTKPGAQEYLNSVYQQYADWGVDFVKVDDLTFPYHEAEVEGIRHAIDKTGRVIVFSTSPGETPVDKAEHVSHNANIWRISGDFWDDWSLLLQQFDLTAKWAPFIGDGHFPDADMLPLGMVRLGTSKTRFTPDEQVTVMTLWSIFRSPLFFGGDLTKMDDTTLALITNDEVLAVNQHSSNNRQLHRFKGEGRNDYIAWVADVPNSPDKYLAVLNDSPSSEFSELVATVKLSDLGFNGPCEIRDLWKHTNLAPVQGAFSPVLPWHGATLFRVREIKDH
jgi:hypothetical protein